jgi:hypothetical protein
MTFTQFGNFSTDAAQVAVRNMDLPPISTAMDAAPGGDLAFLISELAKRDTVLREPLTAVTYLNDMPMEVGGGYMEFLQAFNVSYGASGGAINGPVKAPGANVIPTIQANVGTDVFTAHTFKMNSLIKFEDMSRGNIVGRSIDQMNKNGINLFYRKHSDANAYTGIPSIGTKGLLNYAGVYAHAVASVGTATSLIAATEWASKTPDEIVADITFGLSYTWNQAGNDIRAYPNHIVLPYKQLQYISATRMSSVNDTTILEYVLKTYFGKQFGLTLDITGTAFAAGAGEGNPATDRMTIYRKDPYFLKMGELVPLNRYMTAPDPNQGGYTSCYIAHLTQVCILYPQTVTYWDGI